jgi:hypothetical protein
MSVVDPPKVATPSPFANSFARRILGFAVWFAIGLAPFLGKVRVPGFTAVIEMYPLTLQRWLIPLSGLVMGMIAVAIEFASERHHLRRTLTRWFIGTVAAFVVSLIVLLYLYKGVVTGVEQSVRLENGEISQFTQAVVTASTRVPSPLPDPDCGCRPGQTAAKCLVAISLAPENIDVCFGSEAVSDATVHLALVYLALTSSFAAAVGLLMLDQRRRRTRQ